MKPFIRIALAVAVIASIANASDKHSAPAHDSHTPAKPAATAAETSSTPTADDGLAKLKAGNARFVAGTSMHPHNDVMRRHEQAIGGQTPFVSILSCADSRVPAELLFDAGVGDLFVTRVAGNISCTSEIGTLEYGAGHLHTPLIVVMGHTKCGAVTAAVKHAEVHGSIPMLIEHIAPAVQSVQKTSPNMPEPQFIEACIHANVNQAIKDTLERSEALRELVGSGKVKIVGAVYDIETGSVEWTGEHPELSALLGKPTAEAKRDEPKPEDHPEPKAHTAAAKKPAAH